MLELIPSNVFWLLLWVYVTKSNLINKVSTLVKHHESVQYFNQNLTTYKKWGKFAFVLIVFKETNFITIWLLVKFSLDIVRQTVFEDNIELFVAVYLEGTKPKLLRNQLIIFKVIFSLSFSISRMPFAIYLSFCI